MLKRNSPEEQDSTEVCKSILLSVVSALPCFPPLSSGPSGLPSPNTLPSPKKVTPSDVYTFILSLIHI